MRTRRGRDGGSFVTYDRDAAVRLLETRVRALSRIELRDLSLRYAGDRRHRRRDRGRPGEPRRRRELLAIHAGADLATAGGARRAVGRFQLEVAAISQSPRLVHEEVRLQSEAGPLLWLCLREQEYRDLSRRARTRGDRGHPRRGSRAARRATIAQATAALEWLVDEKVRLEQAPDLTGKDCDRTRKVRGHESRRRHPAHIAGRVA